MAPMRWIRQHIRGCTGLALAALALQFVLTFGHVHLEEFATPAPASATAATVVTAGGAGGDAPVHHRHVDYLCAVCVSITMLAASVPPVLHRLAPPRLLAVAVAEFAATARPPQPRLRFQARAPPLA